MSKLATKMDRKTPKDEFLFFRNRRSRSRRFQHSSSWNASFDWVSLSQRFWNLGSGWIGLKKNSPDGCWDFFVYCRRFSETVLFFSKRFSFIKS
jgi:hypothetical protein